MSMHYTQRGFTLLIAVILSSVVVTVGLALSDIAYKQVILASTAKQSQYAFYAADAALECALYYDQVHDAFNTNPNGLSSLSCNGQSIAFSSSGSSPKVTTFSIPCAGGGTQADVRVYKDDTTAPENKLYASGYNSCSASDPRRIERGLKVTYGGTAEAIPPPDGGGGGGGGGGGTATYAANVNFLRSPVVFAQNGVGTARTSLAASQLTVADEYSGAYGGAKAVDGSPGDSNRWTTSNSTNICDIMFRTDGTTNISKIIIQSSAYPSFIPVTLSVQYWDGSGWVTHFTANTANSASAQEFTTSNVEYAEYWRMLSSGGIHNGGGTNCNLEEIQAFP